MMNKKADIVTLLKAMGQAGKNLPKWVAKNPRKAVALGIPTGAIAGKLGAGLLTSWPKGIATFGDDPSLSLPKGSYLSTLNPISSVTDGIDRIPAWYAKMFPDTHEGHRAAHTTFKAGAVGLLAAALVGGHRTLKHYAEMDDLETADRPAKRLAGQLSTTFEGSLGADEQEKTAAWYDAIVPSKGRVRQDILPSWNNFFGTAIPLSAMLLAGSLMYNATDNYFDKKRNEALDTAIGEKERALKRLMQARARMAKGTSNPADIEAATADLADEDIYVKDASLNKEALFGIRDIFQHMGAATAAVIIASALGAYAYTRASDENNLKYKAYRKALATYAKNKSGITPITMAPTDAADYFKGIDEAGSEPTTQREQPELDTDTLNKPISVSI